MLNELTEALCKKLVQIFPDFTIYDDGFIPQDFVRPAFCICIGEIRHTQLNVRLIRHSIDITVYAFPPLTESGIAEAAVLQDTIEKVCSILYCGYIKAGGRALKLDGSIKSDCTFTDAYAEFTLYYTDDCKENIDTEKMMIINLKER